MLFSSLNNLPAPGLGKKFYTWQVRASLVTRLKWVFAIVALLALVAAVLVGRGGLFDFFRNYRDLILYSAVPLLSILFPRAVLAWRVRYYELHQYGFVVHFGKPNTMQPGAGWSYWKNYDRAELTDTEVILYPKKPLLRAMKFPCSDNRMTVYIYVSERIAEARYQEVPATK